MQYILKIWLKWALSNDGRRCPVNHLGDMWSSIKFWLIKMTSSDSLCEFVCIGCIIFEI